jgi:hypothetical protein
MKTCFTAVVVSFAACVSYAGELSADTQSVLVSQPAVAQAAAPCTACAQTEVVCTNGQCGRPYNVESSASKSCRNRLFGGYVVKQNTRTVYRPSARR